jgi:methionyl aminopeptidase
MVTLKSPREIDLMAQAGAIVAGTLELVGGLVRPGVSTEALDSAAEEFIRSHPGATPSFKGLYGFPKSLCISINDEIVHGIPSPKRILREGNIVSVDVGVFLNGFHADSAATFPVGEIAPDAQRLLDVTKEALTAGIAEARPGNHVGDIGHAIQKVAESAGFGVVRELVGHGVGQRMHEDPQVPNHGQPRRGPRLQVGMTLALEPMITAGDYATRMLDDKWTVVTADGSLSAHFEHTVAITRDGPRILTKEAVAVGDRS